jgi:hypothetical protein
MLASDAGKPEDLQGKEECSFLKKGTKNFWSLPLAHRKGPQQPV